MFEVPDVSFILDVAPTGGIKGNTDVATNVASYKNLVAWSRTVVTVSEISSAVAVVSIVYGSVVEAI